MGVHLVLPKDVGVFDVLLLKNDLVGANTERVRQLLPWQYEVNFCNSMREYNEDGKRRILSQGEGDRPSFMPTHRRMWMICAR